MDILLLNLGETIKGEVTLDGFQNQIEILSFSHAISQPILHGLNGETRTGGRPQHQDMLFTKFLDLSSVSILDHCDRGTSLPVVTFTLAQTDNDTVNPFEIVTMNNVIISSVSVSGGSGSKPVETLTLNYTAITWLYSLPSTPPNPPASVSASWNFATNSEIK